ncbi:GNAT family N-acetyltransferase [Gorillibacterium sp. CAU 1737]|uniref:GNAT family N-acetyltransferase n=1 Tax=Gorillibacterium sp. CAU 1737 TaxID=3140362 RepID=UPI003261C16B
MSGWEFSIRPLDLSEPIEALRLLALQQASYLSEANVIGFSDIPPLKDTLPSLQESRECFLGCFWNVELAGCIAYERRGEELEICRMMVHPDFFRRGIADQLLHAVYEREAGVRLMRVSAVTTNEPAVRLYEKHGFSTADSREIAPGIYLAEYSKLMGE